jgi:hypothetical protein
MADILTNITKLHNDAAEKLSSTRKKVWAQLDQNLEVYRENLKAEEEKYKRRNESQEKDKSNKETLEMMSMMAQKIDEDNQELMRKNQDLKIQYLC